MGSSSSSFGSHRRSGGGGSGGSGGSGSSLHSNNTRRRKRDLVVSISSMESERYNNKQYKNTIGVQSIGKKLVHRIHNQQGNDRRFNGAEGLKSGWNITVMRYLLERLREELADQHYTEKELKGACVSYFLTKRREYRNSQNPDRSLREREEKKLRSRRYRLFGNRTSTVKLFPPEDQQLWAGVTEELMSDEEDSAVEPGVWVARPPRFRTPALTDLCRRLDAASRHGAKPNRVLGPPSERAASHEAYRLAPHLVCLDDTLPPGPVIDQHGVISFPLSDDPSELCDDDPDGAHGYGDEEQHGDPHDDGMEVKEERDLS